MYIKIGNTQHTVTGASFGANLTWNGIDIATPISGIVETCGDNGFLLRSDNADDWEYQWCEDGTLTFSHSPKPEPEPEPDPQPSDTDIIMLMLGEIIDQAGISLDNLDETVRSIIEEKRDNAASSVGEAQKKS